jgi:hypothetical protein
MAHVSGHKRNTGAQRDFRECRVGVIGKGVDTAAGHDLFSIARNEGQHTINLV